jgi:hypothetical protein
MMRISKEVAAASGLSTDESESVGLLVDEWSRHWPRNRLRDRYYYGHVRVRDIGVSVSPQLARRLDPHVDWAAKCVDWWSDRVQFDGVTVSDAASQDALDRVLAANDMRNLMHKTATVALRHSCAFLAVTSDPETGETVVSGYPATASSAVWDEARKRIKCGLVVVESDCPRGSRTRRPRTVHVYDDAEVIVLRRGAGGWEVSERVEHGMGRVPMEPVSYHPTLERPFGRSRITRTVMSLVDDAQREMMNMTAAAAFAAAPQKFLLDIDRETGRKLAEKGFDAFIGSIFTATANSKGRKPEFGQLTQLSMQPHLDYMRSLASQFSSATGVPLSSLGVVSDNPSSAEAIYASKEDAVVDIQSFIDGCKRSVGNVCTMVLAAEGGRSFAEQKRMGLTVDVHFRKPDRPSTVSQSQAIMSQVQAIPWLADSDVALRELGYDDEQVHQLRSDRRRSQAIQGAQMVLDRNQLPSAQGDQGRDAPAGGSLTSPASRR